MGVGSMTFINASRASAEEQQALRRLLSNPIQHRSVEPTLPSLSRSSTAVEQKLEMQRHFRVVTHGSPSVLFRASRRSFSNLSQSDHTKLVKALDNTPAIESRGFDLSTGGQSRLVTDS